MSATRIRPATPADAKAVVEMLHALAASEGLEPPAVVHTESVRAMLEGPTPRLHVLLAEVDGRIAGYLSYMIRFSAWDAAEYVSIDDVYVRPDARGHGIGGRLMGEAAAIALGRGRIARWEARAENARALAFYERLGAVLIDKVICRWELDALRTFAGASESE